MHALVLPNNLCKCELINKDALWYLIELQRQYIPRTIYIRSRYLFFKKEKKKQPLYVFTFSLFIYGPHHVQVRGKK